MPLNVAEVLKKPVEIVQERYCDIFVPALLPFAVTVVFAIAVGSSVMSMASFGMVSIGAVMGLVGLYLIVAVITSIIATGAIVYMAHQKFNGIRVSYQDGINAAMGRLAPLLLASIVIGIGVALGMMLLVIPGLLWALLTIFTTPEIMISGKDWLDAMKGSMDIVRQNFGDVLVFAIALLIVSAIINIIVGLIPFIGNALAVLITTTYVGVAVTAAYLELERGKMVE